jgi:hypothetical protein
MVHSGEKELVILEKFKGINKKRVVFDFHSRVLAFRGAGGEPPRLRLRGLTCPASTAGVEHPSVPINLVLNVSPLLLVESTTFTIVQLYETTTSSAPVLPLTSFHARLLLQGLRVWQRGRCIRGRYVRDRLLQ